MAHGPRVSSVNVGVPRTAEWFGREVTSAIWKEPVEGPVGVAGVLVRIEAASPPSVAIGALATGDLDEAVLQLLLTDSRVPEGWRTHAQRALRER